MDLHSLQYFTDVVKYHNFTKAAEHNYISQPALSKKISLLEQEIGSPLFIRDTHSVSLTRAGEILNKKAKIILLNYQQACYEINQLDHPQQSSLKIVANIDQEHISTYIDKLASFKNNFQRINLSLNQNANTDVFNALKNNQADLGISTFKPNNKLKWFGLQKDELVLVGNRRVLKKYPQPVKLKLLTDILFLQCPYVELPFINQISKNKGLTIKKIGDFNELVNKLKLQASISILPLKSIDNISQLSWLPIDIDQRQKSINYGWCIRQGNQKSELQLFRKFVHNFFQ